jgi:hypothetical protein
MKSFCLAALALVFGLPIVAAAQTAVIQGTVVLPDGKPAAGARVAAPAPGQRLYFSLNKAYLEKDVEMLADAGGRFSFSSGNAATNVYAIHEQGCALISVGALAASGKIVLQPWGRIEGIFKPAGNSGSNWFIGVNPARPENGLTIPISALGAITGSDGQFSITNVPPGEWQVGHMVVNRGVGKELILGLAKTITVKPGETTSVVLAVTGRSIIGRLAVKTGQADINWREASVTLSNGAHTFALEDGTFRFSGVPAGTWQLTIEVVQGSTQPPAPGMRPNLIIAEGSQQVIVPQTTGSQNSAPLDLGTIVLNPVQPPRIAPQL